MRVCVRRVANLQDVTDSYTRWSTRSQTLFGNAIGKLRFPTRSDNRHVFAQNTRQRRAELRKQPGNVGDVTLA